MTKTINKTGKTGKTGISQKTNRSKNMNYLLMETKKRVGMFNDKKYDGQDGLRRARRAFPVQYQSIDIVNFFFGKAVLPVLLVLSMTYARLIPVLLTICPSYGKK